MDNGVYICAATDCKGNYGMMISFFDDKDDAEPREVCFDFSNLEGNKKVEYYLIDNSHDNVLIREEIQQEVLNHR